MNPDDPNAFLSDDGRFVAHVSRDGAITDLAMLLVSSIGPPLIFPALHREELWSLKSLIDEAVREMSRRQEERSKPDSSQGP